MAPDLLDNAIEALRAGIEEMWDADASMSEAHVVALPPGRFALAAHVLEPEALHAIYCLSSADIAYGHVLIDDRFRQWLLDVAIPVALQKREMTSSEQEALRG